MIHNTIHRTCETGGVETVADYRIAKGAEAHVARILRNMYKDPEVAVAREYLCNAVDAHRLSGTKKSIQIHVPTKDDPVLRIRDFGLGLNKADSERLLFGFGASGKEKRESNEFIGGFGLGCKSAFAVTQQFTYTIWHGGRKRVWVCALDEKDVAKAFMLSDAPSEDDTGIQIEIPVPPAHISEYLAAVQTTVSLWDDTYLGSFMETYRTQARTNMFAQKADVNIKTGIEVDGRQCDIWWRKSHYANEENFIVVGDDTCGLRYGNPWGHDHGGTLVVRVPVGTLDLTPSRDDIQQTDKGKNLMAAVGAALKVEIDKLQKRLMATTDLAEWLTGLRVFSVLGLPDGNRRLHDRTYEQVIDWRGLPCGKSRFFLNTGDSRYVVGVLNGLSISTARATKQRRRRFEHDIVCIGNIDQRGYVAIGARQEDTSGTGNGAPQNAASPGLVVRVPKGSFALYNGRVIQVVNRAWRKAGRPTGLTWRPTGTRINGKTWGWCVVVEADTAADVAKVLPWTAGLPVWEPELGKVTVRGDRGEAVQKTSSLLYRCVSSSDWKRRGSWKLLIPAERKELSNGRDPLLYVTLRDGEVNSDKVYYEVSKAIVKLVGEQVFGIRAAELELVKAHPKLGPRLKDAYVAALTKADDVLRSAGITCPCDSEAERNISSSARAVAYLDDEFVSGIRGFEASKYGQVRKQVRTHIVVGRDDGAKSAALLIRRTFGSVVDGENSSGIVAKLCGEADKTSPLLASVLQHGRTYGLSKSEMPELALLLKQHVRDSK